MSIKVVVDFDLCESNERCVEAAPEVFRVNDKDQLEVLDETPPNGLLESLRDAERVCPRGAIEIVEE
jgi:ferredoxin